MSLVAIVGRPNVGKSTLFNAIIGRRESIVSDKPGTTRDRIYGFFEHKGKSMIIADTGGLLFSEETLAKEIKKQVEFAINESDKIIFVVDGKEGLTPLDKDIGLYIRKNFPEKDIAIVVNKIDNWKNIELQLSEFYELGYDNIFPVSAIHKRGLLELLDWISKGIKNVKPAEGIGIAIIGKPNVGKSSLVNAILGYERCIVSEIPGTTRDSIDTYLNYNENLITLIDTAGLKRKGKLKDEIEYYTLLRTVRSIERSNVCAVLIDSMQPLSREDKRIISLVEESMKFLLIVLTKFDLVPDRLKKDVIEYYRKELEIFSYAPIIITSSLKKTGLDKFLDKCIEISKGLRLKNKELNEFLRESVVNNPPPMYGKRPVFIYNIKQVDGKGLFFLETNLPEGINENYLRYLENMIRKRYAFEGIPIKIILKRRKG
uniref:GTPase Der n=1 Tax=candidate division WOR-3 bacterium TaxID=2052148 RepID=A0A7C4YJB2_UNCW3